MGSCKLPCKGLDALGRRPRQEVWGSEEKLPCSSLVATPGGGNSCDKGCPEICSRPGAKIRTGGF
eukprot:1775700-Pyramimonas_sp.AAC.1